MKLTDCKLLIQIIALFLYSAILVPSAGAEENEDTSGSWAQKITASGLLEAEIGYENFDFVAGGNDEAGDIVLATVELGIDADIVNHVQGHVLLLHEEDDTPLEVDEGIIAIDGEDVVPLFMQAGQMYLPFGNFNSHFISNPLTLELGETRESGFIAGFRHDFIEISAGVFNGDIDKTGNDDMVQSYVVSTVLFLPEDLAPHLGLSVGGSYLSNIADSDTLQGEDGVDGVSIDGYVGGVSGFISLAILDRFFLEGEYLGAVKEFKAGELGFDGGEKSAPKAWNVEAAVAIIEDLEVGFKYEGSADTNDLFPKSQFGGVVIAGLFENTSLGIEYLYGKFDNDDVRHLLTAQLAVEF